MAHKKGHTHKLHIIIIIIIISSSSIVIMASLFKLSTVLSLNSAVLQLCALSVCYLLIYIFVKLGFIELSQFLHILLLYLFQVQEILLQ